MEADKSLAEVNTAWRNYLASEKRKVNAPESSRCYFEVGVNSSVQEKAMCGPVHFAGEDTSTWQSLKLSLGPARSDGQKPSVYPAPKSTFTVDTPLPNAKLMTADGSVADAGQQAPAPELPAAPGGSTYPSATLGGGTSSAPSSGPADPIQIRAPGRSYKITIAGPALTANVSNGNWVKAPDGGGLYTLSISDSTSSASADEAGSDLTWKVSSAGQSWDLKVPPHSNQGFQTATTTVTIAVPQVDQATLDVSDGTVQQQVRLKDRTRVTGGPADGYYLNYTTGEQSCPTLPSDATYNPGCTAKITRTAYDAAAKKWAAPGKMLVLLTVSTYPKLSAAKNSSGFAPSYTVDSTSLSGISLGGAAPVSSRDVKGSFFQPDRVVYLFEVPLSDDIAMSVAFTVTSEGSLNASFLTPNAPKTAEQNYEAHLDVPMKKSSS